MPDDMNNPPSQDTWELFARISDKYIRTERDDVVCGILQSLVFQMRASIAGSHPEGQVYTFLGDAGAGKTWLLERAVDRVEGLRENLLRLTAPSPCTLKQLGRALLHAAGYPLQRELADHLIWERVRHHLKASGIRFIWLDEAHHTMGRCHEDELTRLRDTLKTVTQQRDWPVSLILSGLPVLSTFVGGDRQIERRSRTYRFKPLVFPEDARLVKGVVQEVVVKHAGMRSDGIVTDEFAHRLIRAVESSFGSAIALTRKAVLAARLRDGQAAVVNRRDFAEAYADERACADEENIFLAADWHRIMPSNSRLDHAPPNAEAGPKKPRGGRRPKK